MFDEFLKRFSDTVIRRRVTLKEKELNLLLVLFKKRKVKQYSLEKALRERGWKIAHSTVTSMLPRLTRAGLIHSSKNESDNRTYYEISPFGVSSLVLYRKVDLKEAVEHFVVRPAMYYEVLARMQPHLKDYLTRRPPIFLDQLTDDLWIIYTVKNREDLRRQTMACILGRPDNLKEEERGLHYELQLICVNRIEIEGKGICFKEKKVCHFVPSEVSKCDIIRGQMEREWASSM